MIRAFKFLAAGAVGLFSGYAWPQPAGGEPGEWVEAGGDLEVCRSGVHACRAEDLVHWIDEELWVVDLDGAVATGKRMLVAERGRLVERVTAWDPAAARKLTDEVRERARTRVAPIDTARVAAEDVVLGLAADMDWLAVGGRPDGVPPRMAGAPPAAAIAANVCFVAAHLAGLAAAGGDPARPEYAAGVAEERARQLAWLLPRVGLAPAP